MNIKIENVGIIKHADVKLNGLTVIAGENDSGKSTVGKLIFSIVKAVNQYEQILNEDKRDKVKRMIEDIYVLMRNIDSPILSHFDLNTFYSQLVIFGMNNPNLSDRNKEDLNKLFSSRINLITSTNIKTYISTPPKKK